VGCEASEAIGGLTLTVSFTRSIWPGNANSFLDFLNEVRWQDFHIDFWED
jgi:hypothetical protein